jgi:hypothetical protein
MSGLRGHDLGSERSDPVPHTDFLDGNRIFALSNSKVLRCDLHIQKYRLFITKIHDSTHVLIYLYGSIMI